jgi:LmbE family N-acetylglucosaminyl deacetylase
MKRSRLIFAMAWLGFVVPATQAQSTAPSLQTIKGPDERFKVDILLVVAHPDDEGGATPYLARAIYDEHKRVAVVYTTRGGSGGNDYTREHGSALADIREQEARQACARLGITNVWFLDGKDTASQNVLNSLSNWGHGGNLEALVRLVRLTRPEAIITWLPGIFIGENHGDHQASGVLATEAFDMANEPTAFAEQVAGASKRLEPYLENLTPWQPKKLYFFSDADDQKQFDGRGPSYSIKEISPAQRKPYWRLAMDAAIPHLTQFPEDIQRIRAMSDEQISKMMDDPQHSWWSEPMTLVFGKAAAGASPTEPIFPQSEAAPEQTRRTVNNGGGHYPLLDAGILRLGGPWLYYAEFRRVHKLESPVGPIEGPEIAVKAGSVLQIPFLLMHRDASSKEFTVKVTLPDGWTVVSGAGLLRLPNEDSTALRLELQTPESHAAKEGRQPVEVNVEQDGKSVGTIRLMVQLKASALPQ